jgi:uncharacterized protein YbjT (DUF2867 family)
VRILVTGATGFVGANLSYRDVIRRISRACGRRAYPFPIPAPLLAAAGHVLERASRRTGRRPLLTAAYGRRFDPLFRQRGRTGKTMWDGYVLDRKTRWVAGR